MRIKLFLFILVSSIIFSFQTTYAQGISLDKLQSVKVNQLSDAQINEAWKKIQDLGIPEQEAYKLLESRGMDPFEVNAFKQRITMMGLSRGGVKIAGINQKDDIDFSRDTLNIVEKPRGYLFEDTSADPNELSIYGTDFFNKKTIKFLPDFNLATPKSYVLGPGDELIILLTGLNETTVRSTVSPEGTVQIPFAGIVFLNGFTIEQARSIIKNKMAKAYPALVNGGSQLTVNLGNPRLIKVTLIGEVKIPGSYTISSLSTLFNALYHSGGPSKNGTLRMIELIRNNKVYKTVDFYTFLQKGLMDGNIRLEDQDVINFPVYQKRVSISGEVKRPAIYELKATEQLQDLVNYSGGFSDMAYQSVAKVEQVNEVERTVKDVPTSLFSNFTPKNGDKIIFGSVQNRFANRVILEGAVNRPGVYELSAGFTLSALLKKADGLKDEAYPERAYIKRTLPNFDKEFISFKPEDILNGKKDIPLLREDSVMIHNRADFINDQYVTIFGNVNKPGRFLFRKGMKLADVIALAGGLNEQAAGHNLEISRILKNSSDSVANQQVETFTVNIQDASNNGSEIELQALDYISVPRLVNFRPLGNISVNGEVLFPGDYAIQKRDEMALDFIKRAGGISPYGSLESAQIYRNKIRVNLDLTQVNINSVTQKSMILLAGDSIYIPRVISFVKVAGAVNNPQYVSFQSGRGMKYYINAAGGYLEDARVKGTYIQYANGLNKPVRNFLFFKNYPKISPGSSIQVPQRNPNSKLRLGFAEISGITSAVTALIGLIAILGK
ncbi:SLBB domain-containing protein [Daejeonella sp.]|jgi:protein involved in polysaccharide export with SLBB domain|uniref:SLBB domain-containing protein n=1 Tax=Daejeonella sp. TaxID=2805397 RepID=UPI0037845A30